MARPPRPRARRLASVAVALVGMTVIAAGPMTVSAFAHSDLISTLPSNSARLDRPPAKVSFAFDSPLLQGTATIAILGSHNNLLESQKVTPDGETISMAWPAELHTGAYQVRYRGVSG
ncbi:MAG: copper resistance protein CopC, partial [Actinomycetota bacterium]|nr:copper resistance protein CopC [Actinomycetota bacterium]